MPLINTKQPKTMRKSKRTLTGGIKHKIIINPMLTVKENIEYETLDELIEIIAEAMDVAQVEKDTVTKHERLNDKLFEPSRGADMVMIPAVREALLKIAHTFIDTWKLPESAHVKIVDIIVTGSNANYNYTPFSDIDLHCVYDPGVVEVGNDEHTETIKNLLNTKKQLWAKQHDIHVCGYNVELYAQIVGETNIAGGTYSLMSDAWVKIPSVNDFHDINDQEVIQKSQEFIKEIDNLIDSKADESAINEMLNKIHEFRVQGLNSGGEDSVENKAFKVLRNSGYIGKLFDYRKNIEDNDLSL